ncbi:MAG: hypothetical protein AAGJ83_00380, partial [Planctomycetota bacterium]
RVPNTTLGSECSEWMSAALERAAKNRLTVIKQANAVAQSIPDANHLKPSGREKLFNAKYPLSHSESTTIDAFVTGQVTTDRNLRNVNVTLFSVHNRRSRALKVIDRFSEDIVGNAFVALRVPYAKRDLESLEELGASILHPMEGSHGIHPSRGDLLATLEVLYDGIVVEPTFDRNDGIYKIPEPTVGQKMALRVRRFEPSDRPIAAVIKVNGENVLFRSRDADFAGPKYVLEPEADFVLRGFQNAGDLQKASEFVIASAERSKQIESFYGDDVGTITMTLFKEAKPGEAVSDYYLSLARGNANTDAPRPRDAIRTRGIIEAGSDDTAQSIRLVEPRQWNPTPVHSIVLQYYRSRS